MFTPVQAMATPRNTCHASLACRDERVAPCSPTSATRLVTTFPFAKMQRVVSRCDVTSQVEFWLYRQHYTTHEKYK